MLRLECPEVASLDRLLHKNDAWIVKEPYPVKFIDEFDRVVFEFVIEPGFVTDGASVPWLFRGFFPRMGTKSDGAALIHDILYGAELVDRDTADKLFHVACLHFGTTKLKADLMYSALVVGGWWTWRKHTEQSIADNRKYVSSLSVDLQSMMHFNSGY